MNRATSILVALLALGGGGAYYFFKIHTPARENRIARDEIERWEVRAKKVRDCLLGPAPPSPVAAEAIAIRELANTPPDYKQCTAPIGDLSRGDASDTGIADVELAWRSIAVGASQVANAFSHLFDPGNDARAKAIADLGTALDSLAVSHRVLRNAAGMGAPELGGGAELGKVELIALGTAKRAKLAAWLRPSAGGVIALVEGGAERAQQLVLVPGQPPVRSPYQGDVRPSITAPKSGVHAADGAIALGPITDDGAIEKPTAQLALAKPTSIPHVLFTLGTAADTAFAYIPDAEREAPQLSIGRTVSGSIDLGTPFEAAVYAFALAPPNRGLLVWSHQGVLRGMLVRPGQVPKPVELGPGGAGQSCLTSDLGWIASNDRFFVFDGVGAATQLFAESHELIGCDSSAVLLRQAGQRYTVCQVSAPASEGNTKCRVVDLLAGDSIAGLSGGAVIAVATHGKVLAVWREQAPPRYFSLPSTMTPKLLHASATVLDVIGETDNGLQIARVKL